MIQEPAVPKKADVVIIGGGVNGCSLAYQLAQKNLEVVLCERSTLCSGATGRCGAGIRQQWSTSENIELSIKSMKLFEQLEQKLHNPIGLRKGGYLISIHHTKELEQSEKNVALQQSLGLDVSLLSSDELCEVVPILDVHGMNAIAGTYCPTDGHADPFKTTFAYAYAAQQAGAHLHTFTDVKKINVKNKKIQNVETSKGSISTPIVVNAAGAWSKQLAGQLGVPLPNVPLRKEIMVTERVTPMFESMVISFTDGIYFSQQPDGQILGGIPNPHEKPGYYSQPTFQFLQHMSQTLSRYAPILRPVRILRQWTGYYDVTPDARPILGEVNEVEGFLQCNGFSGHGFMLSPMVTYLLTEYIVSGKHPEILERLSINRFKGKKIDKEINVVG